MKVLLDHNIPAKIHRLLTNHEAHTAQQMRWDLLSNGDLLRAAEVSGYQVCLTADQGIFYQQNNRTRVIALVVLTTNDWEVLRWHLLAIDAALSRATAGSFELLTFPRS